MAKMDDDTLLSHLETLERQAVGWYTGQIVQDQSTAMNYYLQKPFGTEEEGRSQVVSSDVWDVVEGMTPMILRPFVASDEVVRFNPLGPDDEDQAEQESDYINWVVTQRNDSFTQLMAWCKTGLLQKNGVVKYWWEVNKTPTTERYFGLSDDLFALIGQDKDVEIVQHTATQGEDGETLHDVVLRTETEEGMAMYAVLAPEEFLISRSADNPDPKKADFVQHRRMVTIGALRAMGYDVADDINDGSEMNPLFSPQYLARRSEEENGRFSDHMLDPTAREVLLRETYWRVDVDGDGVPELRKLCAVGREILENEETEEIPFSGWTPYPQPFKFYGRCPADETVPIQTIKSTLWRQSLDNIYTINNNRVYANEGVNLDDLIDNQIAGVVRVKGMGNVSQSVMSAQITPIMGVVQPMIEYLDSAKENRTGFTRYNQGSDSNSLNKTATGVRIITENANLRVEVVSRSFANGVADLMRGIHGLCRRHATKEETVRLRGKWVTIDPRGWKKRMDMTVSVGLGTADQQMKLQGLQMLLGEQKELAAIGLVQPENFLNAASKLAEALGFKNPEMFFSQAQQQQKPPMDPQIQEALQHAHDEITQLTQDNQQLKSGMAVKQMEGQQKLQVAEMDSHVAAQQAQMQQETERARIESAERIAAMNNDTKRDIVELQGMIQMLIQKMEPPPELAADVSEDLKDPELDETGQPKQDPMALLAQAISGMNAPKRKRMSIVAPSGAVYQGEISDHDGAA